MPLSAETKRLMGTLYDYVRTGREVVLPNADGDRLSNYRRLVRNIFDDTLRRAYPITFEVLSAEEWDDMINTFMEKARPQTPYIWKMPFEFYEFAVNEDFAAQFDRPYLDDLLFFEWIEIEIFTMPDQAIPDFRNEGDFLNDKIVVNPDFRIIELAYPVHTMPAAEAVNHEGQYFVLSFREQESGEVRFVDLSPLLAFVWQELAAKPVTGHQLLQRVYAALPEISEDQLMPVVLPFLNDMLLQGAILGFAR